MVWNSRVNAGFYTWDTVMLDTDISWKTRAGEQHICEGSGGTD